MGISKPCSGQTQTEHEMQRTLWKIGENSSALLEEEGKIKERSQNENRHGPPTLVVDHDGAAIAAQ